MKRATFLLFLCAGCAAPTAPSPAEPSGPAPEAAAPAAPSIAGEYGAGITGDWRSFELNADGTWSSRRGCCTGINGGHRGHWKESDGRAWLRVEEEMGACGWREQPEWTRTDGMIPLTILRWGERIYLIADGEWLHFVNDVNQKSDLLHFLRPFEASSLAQNKATGLPMKVLRGTLHGGRSCFLLTLYRLFGS